MVPRGRAEFRGARSALRARAAFRTRVAGANGRYGEPMRLADTVAAALLARLPGDAGAAACPARTPHRRRRRSRRGRGGERRRRPLARSTAWRPGSGSVGARSSSGTRSSGWSRRSASLDERVGPRCRLCALRGARGGRPRRLGRRATATATDDGCSSAPRPPTSTSSRAPTAAVAARPASGEWRTSLDRDDFEARVEAILELLRGGRLLPGEPHPAAHRRRRARPGRAVHVARARAIRLRTPACCGSSVQRPADRGRVGVARALPVVARPRRGDAADQGHRRRRRPPAARAPRTTPRT